MKELFKQYITDFHQSEYQHPTPRQIEIPDIPSSVRKAFVLIGMRRSGKTWILYQRMQMLQQQGIKKEQMFYINFEDDRLRNITLDDLDLLLKAYFELYPEYSTNKDIHFFFDEVHKIDGWELFIRRLLDQGKIHIYVTGSSAKMLSKEIASSLRGRALTREVFPFSFSEYLTHKHIPHKAPLSSNDQAAIRHHLTDYLAFGGFPEVVNMSPNLHRETLQSYIDTVVYRDIIERYGVTNAQILRAFLVYCLENPASLLSINKTYNRFKSMGYKLSKDTLYEFMNHFNDVYCIFSLPIFDFSHSKTTLKPKKIYPIDQGLITAYSMKQEYEHASRFETTVFAHLRRQTEHLFYYQTKNGKEVDFVVQDNQGSIELVQASLSIKDEDTRKREVTALEYAMEELQIKQSSIITLDETETIETSSGVIKVIPLVQLLLI